MFNCCTSDVTHHCESKNVLKSEFKSQEQKTPKSHITTKLAATQSSQYGASDQNGEELTPSLPEWFIHLFDSDYQTHYLESLYAIQKLESDYIAPQKTKNVRSNSLALQPYCKSINT